MQPAEHQLEVSKKPKVETLLAKDPDVREQKNIKLTLLDCTADKC